MKVPLSWLKDYVDIDLPVDDLAEKLTLAGLEVENIDYIGVPMPESERLRRGIVAADLVTGNGHIVWERDHIVVGQIIASRQHPNADRLLLATVAYGADQPMTIITGAPNLQPGDHGQKVAFAGIGATLIDPYAETFRTMKLKPNKIRGIRSEGMACSEKELGISQEHTGIMILPEDAPVGMPLADYLGDVVFDIAVTPNMIRISSIIGVAREVAAITGASLHIDMPTWQTHFPPASDYCDVIIADPDLCYRFTATIIRDVEVKPSPFWMQQRLRRVGQRPINNLVDITNYVMFEWGKPLHAFDYDSLLARAERVGDETVTIIVQRAKEGDTFKTLDDITRHLDDQTLMICDSAGPVGIGGVMGGADTEVSEVTRNVLLESANFNFINIRRTATQQKLPSEAAYRFSRGIPAELDPIGNIRGAQLMAELGGGTIASGIVEDYPQPQQVVEVPVTAAEVRRILGIDLSEEEILQILHRLEFATRVEGMTIWATQPWHRLDVTITADLLEEIARIYGYDNIPVTMMADSLPPQRRNWIVEQEESMRDILVATGLQDTINYPLTTIDNHTKLFPGDATHAPNSSDFVTLANPLSSERVVMRRTLVVSALEDMQRNLRYKDAYASFEIGMVYLPETGDGLLPMEERRLVIALTGPRKQGSWLENEGQMFDFFDLKGVIEVLLERMRIEDISFAPAQLSYCGPVCARILVAGNVVGTMGELHPTVRAAYELPHRTVAIAELSLDPLLPAFQRVQHVQPFSEYPPVKEDIALIVDESIPAGQVDALIRQTGGDLLSDVVLFDVYRGKAIPPGTKSLAYSLTFQSPTKTLTDKDTARLRSKIVARLEREVAAKLRDS